MDHRSQAMKKALPHFGSWSPPKVHGVELAQKLPLTRLQASVANRIEASSGHGKHAARSSVFHLGRAWEIRTADPEMATFRAITAEEEAASAIILALQRCGYPEAMRLQRTDHRDKAAVSVFVAAAGRAFVATGFVRLMQPKLIVPATGSSLPITVRFRVPPSPAAGDSLWIEPVGPLNWEFASDGAPYDFAAELKEIARHANAQTFGECVKVRANTRNHILYAAPDGIPLVDPANINDHLLAKRNEVFRLLLLFHMIDAHEQVQLLVLQSLRTLLSLLAESSGKGRRHRAHASPDVPSPDQAH